MRGEGLFAVSHVVIGGVVQGIDFLGTDSVQVTVSDVTPRGAERVFVAAESASEALTVTVLDPFPTTPEAAPDAGADEDTGPEEDVTSEPEPVDDLGGDTTTDAGCAGGGAPGAPAAWMLLGLIAVMTRRAVLH